MRRLCLLLISFLATLLLGANAQAQALVDKVSAEALFNEGIALVKAGNITEACSKFEGSQALEPMLGTELRLADCYQRLGRTASAWALFEECRGMARRRGERERESLARERIEQLTPRLSYLVVESSQPELAGLTIQRDGRYLPIASLGTRIPIDPGMHDISAAAPSWHAWSTSLSVPAGPSETRIRIPRLETEQEHEQAEEIAALDSLALAPAAARPPARARPSGHPPANNGSSAQATIGVVASVAGLVGLASGAGLGLYAKHEDWKPHSLKTAAVATLVASGAILTTGVLLWSTAPNSTTRGREVSLRAEASPTAFRTALVGSF